MTAITVIALGAAAFFIVTTEQSIAERRAALRAFDRRSREAATALADARAGQQAYVAAGQSAAFWIPKVATLSQDASEAVDELRASAAGAEPRRALLEASQALAEFGTIDKRVREYLRDSEAVMAGDVAFSEGGDAAGRAASNVEAARLGEHQTFDAYEAAQRKLEAYAAGGALGGAVLILALLGFARQVRQAQPVAELAGDESLRTEPTAELPLKQAAWPDNGGSLGHVDAQSLPAREAVPALRAAADLCTEFGQIRDSLELKTVLGRSARLLEASGLVVWLGDAAGADLRPVIAHGYSDQVLGLMRPVSRMADNAAAAAYRSGTVQIVAARTGSLGAVVAPLLSADGCVGALTAEIRDGHETSSEIQALASIFAAQLAGVLAPSVAANVPQSRTASA